MVRTVMLLGGSRYYSRAIEAAHAAGCRALVIDGNPDAYCAQVADVFEAVDVTDVEGVVAAARRHRVDGIVPLNDFSVRAAAVAAELLGLPGNPPSVADVATDKAAQKARWREAGVPTAAHVEVWTLTEAIAAVDAVGGYPVVVKPSDSRGGGSRGVSKVRDAAELGDAFAWARTWFPERPTLVEACIVGLEHSVEMIVHEGQVYVLAVSDKVKTGEPYRVDKAVVYPTVVQGARRAALERVAAEAITALGVRSGGAQVEMATVDDGFQVFEIGARCGGGGTPHPITTHVSGVNMLAEVVRIALGEPPEHQAPLSDRGCVYRFLTPAPGVLASVEGVAEVARWPGVLDCDVLRGPGDRVHPVRTGADRAGFVITGAESRDDAIALADRAEAAIRFRYVDQPAERDAAPPLSA